MERSGSVGRVIDLESMCRRFEPYLRHRIVPLSKKLYPIYALTFAYMAEKALTWTLTIDTNKTTMVNNRLTKTKCMCYSVTVARVQRYMRIVVNKACKLIQVLSTLYRYIISFTAV